MFLGFVFGCLLGVCEEIPAIATDPTMAACLERALAALPEGDAHVILSVRCEAVE